MTFYYLVGNINLSEEVALMPLIESDITNIKLAQKMLQEKIVNILFDLRNCAVLENKDSNKYRYVSLSASELLIILREDKKGMMQAITDELESQNSFIAIVRGANTEKEVKNALEYLVKIGEFLQGEKKCKITKLIWKEKRFYTCEFI